ncbi:MAG: three-Cys-motif partner protein TcmP [Deltaproteobacteria bacterium]|nr:three-Cys-motif partner protein TcmP [Deltaproteobacteria bacterium]
MYAIQFLQLDATHFGGGASINAEGALHSHPDQRRLVEDHQQTEHKLELYRRYAPHWASIISTARGSGINSSHLFLIDGFAGGGIHGSRDHPDGMKPGTAMLACRTAREIQRRYGNQVHVRLVDCNPDYCTTLERLTVPFRDAEGHDRVDVRVIRHEFADVALQLLAETEPHGRQFRSLWFLDPYGSAGMPYTALYPLDRVRNGPELIVNFDTAGVRRQCGNGHVASIDAEHKRHLDDLYGGEAWVAAFIGVTAEPRDALVSIYRNRFPGFPYGGAYQLRQSEGQLRHFVHLAKVQRAQTAFKEDYDASFRTGLLAGRSLNDVERSRFARRLFEAFRSEVLTLEDMHAARVAALDRGQLMTVLRRADQDGYGTWDEMARVMRWRAVRLEPPELLLNFE